MAFRRGDLLLVPFPFTDLSATKRRPVLTLTGPDGYGDFVGLPVTSRPHHTDVVAISMKDLTSGSLPAPSLIRTDRVITLNVSLVVRSVASLAEAVVQAAARQLCGRLCRLQRPS